MSRKYFLYRESSSELKEPPHTWWPVAVKYTKQDIWREMKHYLDKGVAVKVEKK